MVLIDLTHKTIQAINSFLGGLTMSDVLKILFHLSTIKKVVTDIEQLVQDLLAKKPIGDDAKKSLEDLGALISDEVITIPGVSTADASKVVDELKAAIAG